MLIKGAHLISDGTSGGRVLGEGGEGGFGKKNIVEDLSRTVQGGSPMPLISLRGR